MSNEEKSIALSDQVKDQVLFSFLGEMMGVIAHDLNNPLMIVMGKADMIKRGVESKKWDDQRVMESAQKIVETGQKMANLIEVFRQLSISRGRTETRSMAMGQILDELEIFFKKKLSYSDGSFTKDVVGTADKVISVNFMKMGLSLIPWMNFVIDRLKDHEGPREVQMKVAEEAGSVKLSLTTPLSVEEVPGYNDPNKRFEESKELGLNFFLSEQAALSWDAQFKVESWAPLSISISWSV